jgi:hypothetical protein
MSENTLKYTTDLGKLFSKDQIMEAILKFERTGNNHAKLGQRLGLSIMADLDATGNMHYVWDFFDHMPVNVSPSAFKDWLIKYAKVKEPQTEKERGKAKHGLCFDKDATTNLEGANTEGNQWWTFKPEKPTQALDMIVLLESVVKRTTKASDDDERGEIDGDFIHPALLRDVAALVDRYKKVRDNGKLAAANG